MIWKKNQLHLRYIYHFAIYDEFTCEVICKQCLVIR